MADRNMTFDDLRRAIDSANTAAHQYNGGASPRILRLDHTTSFSLVRELATAEANRVEAPYVVPALIDYNLATDVNSPRWFALRNALRRAPRYRRIEFDEPV